MNTSSAVFPGLTQTKWQVFYKHSLICNLFEMEDYLDFDCFHIFGKEPAVA